MRNTLKIQLFQIFVFHLNAFNSIKIEFLLVLITVSGELFFFFLVLFLRKF